MVTKLVYFRPDKRFVKDDILENKYTCLIKDKFTLAESSITVPICLTVFQHHTPKNCMNKRKLRKENQSQSSSTQFQEKLIFYLIGSSQQPPLHELTSNTRNIDRIEFKGHIGFENPVFQIISILPALRKITFTIFECKQGNFIFDADANADDKDLICSPCNKLVTNLNIEVKKCGEKLCCPNAIMTSCQNGNSSRNSHESLENIQDNNCAIDTSNGEESSLETMLIRLLERTTRQCPNIKRLTMDVPHSNNLSKVINSLVKDMPLLKPTKISYSNNRILVGKYGAENFHSQDEDNQTSEIIIEKHNDQPKNDGDITSNSTPAEQETTSVPKIADEVDIENTDTLNSNTDSLEPTPCLFDMSKLLGSMLGIPTSSLPLPSLSSSSSHSSSSSITQAPSNELLIADKQSTDDTSASESTSSNIDFKPVSSASFEGSMNSTANNQRTTVSISSPSVEVITYAAAAASAAATSSNLTATTTCNSSTTTNRHHHNHSKNGGNDIGNHHRHHHHHHHHINEGSRRTFVKDGEGAGLRGDEDETIRAKQNKSVRKPSITHVADLGKPVFISSSCKSPHKRGI